jgi:hypothetical protein
MGSDLYIAINRQFPNGYWEEIFTGPSAPLERGIVINAFGSANPTDGEPTTDYVPKATWEKGVAKHPECPWRLDEPYWVRKITGQEFVAIVREKRWQKLQDGDFADHECGPLLRAYAALVESLLAENVAVVVFCWDSQ